MNTLLPESISLENINTIEKASIMLDKNQFIHITTTYALRLPSTYIATVLPLLKKYKLLYNKPYYVNIRHVIEGNDQDNANNKYKFVLLDDKINNKSRLPQSILQSIEQHNNNNNNSDHHNNNNTNTQSDTSNNDIEIIPYTLELNYDNLTADYVLSRYIPSDITLPSSFETIGHIAHLNLTQQLLPYKYIIGNVLLSKNSPRIRTVINKDGSITNQYRVYKIELLAGINDYNVTVKEHDNTYKFDVSKVYWNSKLSTEHSRITQLFSNKQVIVDLCCGVGPFVIPILKQYKNCIIYANDLNIDSINCLKQNIKLNKINTNKNNNKIHIGNIDAKKYLQQTIQQQLTASIKNDNTTIQCINHILMNLPALSISMCDMSISMYTKHNEYNKLSQSNKTILHNNLPIVHVHCFAYTHDNNAIQDAIQRIQGTISYKFTDIIETKSIQNQKSKQFDLNDYNNMYDGKAVVYNVREVAPNKDMLCVSFRIPKQVAFKHVDNNTHTTTDSNSEHNDDTTKQQADNIVEPHNKKFKT